MYGIRQQYVQAGLDILRALTTYKYIDETVMLSHIEPHMDNYAFADRSLVP